MTAHIRKPICRGGFTLVELMLVVSIIILLVVLMALHFMRTRATANEITAIGTLRTLCNAEMAFKSANALDSDGDGVSEYGTLAQLLSPPNGGAPFISDEFADGSVAGYTFTTSFNGAGGANLHFQIIAMPVGPTRGIRSFYVDETGIIRQNRTGGVPSASDPPAEGD